MYRGVEEANMRLGVCVGICSSPAKRTAPASEARAAAVSYRKSYFPPLYLLQRDHIKGAYIYYEH